MSLRGGNEVKVLPRRLFIIKSTVERCSRRRGRRLDAALTLRCGRCLADNIAELGDVAQCAALDGLLAATAYEALARRFGDQFALGSLEPDL